MHLAQFFAGLAEHEGARHVGAVLALAATHVEQDHVTAGQRRVVGLVVRVGRVRAEADDGGERVALRAQFAVDRLQLAGHVGLGDALVHEPAETVHGGIVRGAGGAHKLALGIVLDGARVVYRIRGQHEAARRAALHERQQEAGRQVLVAAQRLVGIAQPFDDGQRIVGVGERAHGAGGVGRRGEQRIQHEGGSSVRSDDQPEEALARLDERSGEIVDGTGIAYEHLLETSVREVAPHGFDALFVHGVAPYVVAEKAGPVCLLR